MRPPERPQDRAAAPATPGGVLTSRDAPRFDVHLDVFTGPFDLLLGLISARSLDVTEVALAEVTDEFVAHARRLASTPAPDGGPDQPAQPDRLGQVSAFCVVAATLLELKAARLLPAGEADAVEDLELLEARDLLFARLLQHRAYSRVAADLGAALARAARAVPRPGVLDADLAAALPPLERTTDAAGLAALAAAALARAAGRRRELPVVATDHLHAPTVSVSEQVDLLAALLAARGRAAFADLAGDGGAGGGAGALGAPALVVARFLAVLELYRRAWVELDQEAPLGPLGVRWVRAGATA